MEKKNPKERMIMALDDEALDRVTGGTGTGEVPECPVCHCQAPKYICENLNCSKYADYVMPYAKIPKDAFHAGK